MNNNEKIFENEYFQYINSYGNKNYIPKENIKKMINNKRTDFINENSNKKIKEKLIENYKKYVNKNIYI